MSSEKILKARKDEKFAFVRLFESFTISGHVFLVFPVHGISLYEFQKANYHQPYEFTDIKCFAEQMLRNGLYFLLLT